MCRETFMYSNKVAWFCLHSSSISITIQHNHTDQSIKQSFLVSKLICFLAAVITNQDVTDKEVQVTAPAHQVEEEEKIWKEVMATEALLNSVWKGNLIILSVRLYALIFLPSGSFLSRLRDTGRPTKSSTLYSSADSQTDLFTQKGAETCRGYYSRRKRC